MSSVYECTNRKNEAGIQNSCDSIMQTHCANNPNDVDVCGCSANVYKKVPDPQLANANPVCWATSCNTNVNAYKFKHTLDSTGKCPNICIDNSTVNAVGSTIIDSKISQSSCGGTNVDIQGGDKKDMQNVYTTGAFFGVSIVICVILLVLSLSSVVILK